jgi:hypothetical protein
MGSEAGMSAKVDVRAQVRPDGSVTVKIDCDGTKAEVVFDSDDVTFLFPSREGELAFSVPEALAR